MAPITTVSCRIHHEFHLFVLGRHAASMLLAHSTNQQPISSVLGLLRNEIRADWLRANRINVLLRRWSRHVEA